MKRCPLGHENSEAASRCEVCLARFRVPSLVRELDGIPEVPLTVRAGEEDRLVVRILQTGGDSGPCTVSVAGEAAPWVAPLRRELVTAPGETVDVRVRIRPPPETAGGLWSAVLRVEGGGPGEALVEADLILRVLEPEDEAPVVPPPPPLPPSMPLLSVPPPPPPAPLRPERPEPAELPVRPPPPASPGERTPRAWLELPDDRVPLFDGEVVLGRHPTVDVVIDDPGASRRHAALRVAQGGGDVVATVHDLGSTNGTYVNGVRVVHAMLRVGDRVTLGRTDVVLLGK